MKRIVLAVALGTLIPAVASAQDPRPLGTPVDSIRRREPLAERARARALEDRLRTQLNTERRALDAARGRLQTQDGRQRARLLEEVQRARVQSNGQRARLLDEMQRARVQDGRLRVQDQVLRAQGAARAIRPGVPMQGVRGAPEAAARAQMEMQRMMQGRQDMMMEPMRLELMQERLQLTEDQLKKIRSLREDMQDRDRELMEQLQKARESNHKKLLDVLTDEQRRMIEQQRVQPRIPRDQTPPRDR